MSKSAQLQHNKQNSEAHIAQRRILNVYKITFTIGLLISGYILYVILNYIFHFKSNISPDTSLFITSLFIICFFLLAPIGAIIVIANYFMLRKLYDLKIPHQHYTLPYLSILINTIPTLIVFSIFIYHISLPK